MQLSKRTSPDELEMRRGYVDGLIAGTKMESDDEEDQGDGRRRGWGRRRRERGERKVNE